MTHPFDTFGGFDEPQEMWLTGEAAILLLSALKEKLEDAAGTPIDPRGAYYLSAATGLIPYVEDHDE